MENKQLSEFIESISRGLDIAGIVLSILILMLFYKIGVLPQAIKIGSIIFCTIAILQIFGTVCSVFFSIIPTAFYIYVPMHWVSKKHYQKYADMFSFRWNLRDKSNDEKLAHILKLMSDTQITYKEVIL